MMENSFGKASMPVVRVKYEGTHLVESIHVVSDPTPIGGAAGPFRIRLRLAGGSGPVIVNCSGNKVCGVENATLNGTKWFELGIYARIGEYHIYQSWHLSDDGELRPIVQSRGTLLQYRPHPPPLLAVDFDIDGNGMDQVFATG